MQAAAMKDPDICDSQSIDMHADDGNLIIVQKWANYKRRYASTRVENWDHAVTPRRRHSHRGKEHNIRHSRADAKRVTKSQNLDKVVSAVQ